MIVCNSSTAVVKNEFQSARGVAYIYLSPIPYQKLKGYRPFRAHNHSIDMSLPNLYASRSFSLGGKTTSGISSFSPLSVLV